MMWWSWARKALKGWKDWMVWFLAGLAGVLLLALKWSLHVGRKRKETISGLQAEAEEAKTIRGQEKVAQEKADSHETRTNENIVRVRKETGGKISSGSGYNDIVEDWNNG